MKKLFTTAIAICLLLSFCVTGFASSLCITRIYKGNSPVEGDTNEYFYTFVEYEGEETPEEFGVIINGEKYPLSEAELSKAQSDKKFGIGISDPENKLSDFYNVTPYATVGGNDILGDNGAVWKSILYEKMNSEAVTASTEYISADTNSDLDYYSDWYLPDLRNQLDKEDSENTSGTYMQVSIHNGVNDETGNEILNRALIQLDLEKMEGADTSKPIELTVWGHATYWSGNMTTDMPESFTVNAYGTYDYNWTEAGISSDAAFAGPTLSEIKAMPVIDSFEVAVPENTAETGTTIQNDWYAQKINVAKIVEAARRAGKTKATVILLADNSEREQYAYEVLEESGDIINHDEVKFQMFTKDVTKSWLARYKPTVSFYKFTDEYTELSEISINGEAIKGFDAKTSEYTVGYLKAEGIPTVSAKTANEESRAVITQATEENKTATIKVYDEQNIRSKIYKVNFVETLPSTQVTVKDVISDDANSRPNQYSDWYLPTGIYTNVNLYNGAAYASGSNATLRRALIKLDLTKLTDVDLTKEINLNVTGIATYNGYTDATLKTMTVDAYADYNTVWSESDLATDVSSVGPGITDILAMEKVGSFTVDVPETSGGNGFENKTVNIASAVKKALAAGKDSVTVILIADNSERAALSNGGDGHPDRNDITFRMGSKENTDASRQPSVSYYKYDSRYTDLAGISVNGKALADFDPAVFEYESSYEDGAEIPVVTATAYDSDAAVDIEQATEENSYIATITVSNSGMQAKVYTVSFVTDKASENAVAKNAVIADAHSRVSELAPTAISFNTNLYNGVPYVGGWEGTLKRGYMQVDVSSFKDIDITKDVYLNIYAQATISDTYKTEYCPSELNVNVYAAMKSEFTWNETTAAGETASSFGPNITQMKALPLADVVTVASESYNAGYLPYQVNITKAVKKAIDNNEEYVTLIFSADNSERNTEELQALKAANGNNRDNVTFTVLTKERTVESQKPYVTYYKYDEKYVTLSSIEINGTLISDFAADKTEYIGSFERGSEIPLVTATAFDKSAEVTVDPATEENGYVATITVANEGMTAKTYKVTFEVLEPSYETTVKTAITADANSRIGYKAPDAISMDTNLYNGVAYAAGNESSLQRGYMQVSVAGLANIDLTKKVYLNVYAQASIGDAYKTDYCPTSVNINVYAAMKSEFTWNETTAANVTENSFGPNITQMKALPLVTVITVAQEAYGTGYQAYQIDITEAVKTAIENNEEYVTFMFSADNTDRNTAELQALKAANGNNRDNVTFTILTKERTVESQQPSVTYFAYEAAE